MAVLILVVPDELKKKYKIKCAQKQITMKSMIVLLIEDWLKKK